MNKSELLFPHWKEILRSIFSCSLNKMPLPNTKFHQSTSRPNGLPPGDSKTNRYRVNKHGQPYSPKISYGALVPFCKGVIDIWKAVTHEDDIELFLCYLSLSVFLFSKAQTRCKKGGKYLPPPNPQTSLSSHNPQRALIKELLFPH